MDNKRLEDKIDKIVDNISDINITLAKQSTILDEHVRRSTNLEDRVEPLEKHMHMIQGAIKVIGLVAIFAAIIEGILKITGVVH